MTKPYLITTSCNNLKEAKAIANRLLEDRLAACVQISKVMSTYIWQEEIDEMDEWSVSIKTLQKNYGEVVKVIKELHSYQLPEIIAHEFSCEDEYLNWMKEVCN